MVPNVNVSLRHEKSSTSNDVTKLGHFETWTKILESDNVARRLIICVLRPQTDSISTERKIEFLIFGFPGIIRFLGSGDF